MDLKIKLEQLHQRVDGIKENITTEEATKNALIMFFISDFDIANITHCVNTNQIKLSQNVIIFYKMLIFNEKNFTLWKRKKLKNLGKSII